MKFYTFTFLLLFASNAFALPDAPVPKHEKRNFAIGASLLAASTIADAITTRNNLNIGGWEANPVFGRYPSPGKQAVINLAFFAGQVLAFRFTERSPKPWIRWIGRIAIGGVIEQHARFAVCNAEHMACRPHLDMF